MLDTINQLLLAIWEKIYLLPGGLVAYWCIRDAVLSTRRGFDLFRHYRRGKD